MLDWIRNLFGPSEPRTYQNPLYEGDALRPEYNPQDDDVVGTIMGEAAGEPPEGQQAVLNAIQNRSRMKQMPWSEVVRQPRQFDGYNPNNDMFRRTMMQLRGQQALNPSEMESFMRIKDMVARNPEDITRGATHFYNPQTAASYPWMQEGEETLRTGNHAFRRNVRF